ncbi:DUF4367 domain-containing protein [Fictibacillus arsenicus]|uniref:DUF4367 domain-containing protein n=1 Tax=Fictibacillus arsenicus TaxID=255247 RepID=A0A1V3GAZ6_9BACL|nr:DUF4367 domain-containing protein [Fictibacillus arsenicus]OOE14036.1 hypothetical protein UN64_02145 [Fictibacillus arsenicus]
MENRLTKIREAMLESTFKDAKFSEERKREVMDSISILPNKVSPFKRFSLLKPVMNIAICTVLLGGTSFFIFQELSGDSSQTTIRSGDQIDVSQLKLEHTVGNERKIFSPVSIEKAKEVVLFNYNLPYYLPFSKKEPVATITEWFEDKNKISVDVKYIPDTTDQGARYVELTISNFPNNVNSIIKKHDYHQEVSLNGNNAYLTKNENVDMISWIDNGIEYDLRYYSFKNKSGEESEELLKIAKSMK